MERKEFNEILKFSKEVILQLFIKINKKVEELTKNEEVSALEILERDVISKYEKLYKGLDSELSEEQIDETKMRTIEKYILDIMKENGFTKEFIDSQVAKREELKEDSGAMVVKNLFEYEIKQLKNTKYALIDKINLVLDEEEKLSMELKNAIQEEIEIEYIYKLQPVRAKYRELEAKLLNVQEKLDLAQKKLDSKWQYEIYGTASKEEMLKTYNTAMNIEK